MELELGLKVTRTREDVSSSVDFRFSKDPFGPLVLSRETDSRFIIIIHLKGFKKEGIEIDINKEGDRITISGRKPVEEMVMIRWMAWRKEVEMRAFRKKILIPDVVDLDKIKARFDDDDATLTITMPKRVKGISGFNLELEEEEERVDFGDVSGVENREEVEQENEEREESDEQSETQGEEGSDEMMEDKERESQVFEGEEEAKTEDDDLEKIHNIDEQDKVLEFSEEKTVGHKKLADSDTESEDSGLKKLPGIIKKEDNQELREQTVSEETQSGDIRSGAMEEIEEQGSDDDSSLKNLTDMIEQEDNQEVMEQRVSEETKSGDIESEAVKEIEEQESHGDSGLEKLPDIVEQEGNQEVMEQKVSEETKSDDNGSRVVEKIEEKESHEDSGLKEFPDIIGQEDNQEVMEKRVLEETKSDNTGSGPVEETEEQESHEDSGLKKLPDIMEQEVMEQKVSEETKSDGIGSGEVEEIGEEESDEVVGTSKSREMEKKKTSGDDDGFKKAQGIEEPERRNEVKNIQEMVEGATTSDPEKRKNIKMETKSKDPKEDVDAEMGEGSTPNTERSQVVADKKHELVEKKEEEDTKVRRECEDRRSLLKLQENEEQPSKGRETIKELDEEKNPEAEINKTNDVPKPEVGSVVKTDDEGKEKKKTVKMETAPNIAETETKPENVGQHEFGDSVTESGESSSSLRKPPDIILEQEDVMDQKDSQGETKSDDFGSRAFEEIEKQEPCEQLGGTSKVREKADDDDGLSKVQGIKEPERRNEVSKNQEMVAGDPKEDVGAEMGEGSIPSNEITPLAAEDDTAETEADKVDGRENIKELVKDKAPEAETNIENDVPKPVQETEAPEVDTVVKTDDEGKEKKKSVEMEIKNMGEGFAPNIAETETKPKNIESEKLGGDDVDKIHKLVEKKEEEDANVRAKGEDRRSLTKLQEGVEPHSKARKPQEKQETIKELVEEKAKEAEKNIVNDVPKPVQEIKVPEVGALGEVMEQKVSEETKSDDTGSGAVEDIKEEESKKTDGDGADLRKAHGTEDPERKITGTTGQEKNAKEDLENILESAEEKKEFADSVTESGESSSSLRKPPDIILEQESKQDVVEQKDTQAETRSDGFGSGALEEIEKQEPHEQVDGTSKSRAKADEDGFSSKVQGIEEPERRNEVRKIPEMVEGDPKEDVDAEMGEGFTPKIERTQVVAESETKAEELESIKPEADKVDKKHDLVEKKEEEEENTKARKESEDRRSLIKVQENEEQHSKGRKREDKHENIKEMVKEKAPVAETSIENDVPEPVQKIEPEVGTLGGTGDEGKQRKEKKSVANIAETETKPEDYEADEAEKIQKLVDKKEEEHEVGTQSEDISSVKPQEVGEQQSQGQKQHGKIKELVEEKTPEANKTIVKDTPKPVQKETNDAESRKPQETIRQQELDEWVKSKTNDEEKEEKEIEETATKEQEEEMTDFSKNGEVKEEEKVPEKKTELGDDDISRKAGDSDAKKEVDAEMGKGFTPNIAETETKLEDSESETQGAAEVEKKQEEDANVRAKGEDSSFVKLQEGEEQEHIKQSVEEKAPEAVNDIPKTVHQETEVPEVGTLGEAGGKEKKKSESLDAKEEVDVKLGVPNTTETETKPDEFVSDQLKELDKIHELVEKEDENNNAKARRESEDVSLLKSHEIEEELSQGQKQHHKQEKIEELVEEQTPQAEMNVKDDDDTPKPVQEERGEEGKQKIPKLIQEEKKKQPEEHKEVIRQQDLDEPERCEEERKTQEVVKSKTNDEEKEIAEAETNEQEKIQELAEKKTELGDDQISRKVGDTEQRDYSDSKEEIDAETSEGFTPNIAETEKKADEVDKIDELVEKNKEEKDTVRKKSEDSNLKRLHEQKIQGPNQHKKEDDHIKELVEEKPVFETERPEVDTSETCKDKIFAETETKDQDERAVAETDPKEQVSSYKPKILWDEETAEKKTEFDDHQISRRVGVSEERDSDSKEEVDAEMEKGLTPKTVETETKPEELESDKLEADEIHELVEEEEDNAKVRRQREDRQENEKQHSKRQEKIAETETNIPTPVGVTGQRDSDAKGEFDPEMGKGSTPNISDTETKADTVKAGEEDRRIHELVEKKKKEENDKVRKQSEDTGLKRRLQEEKFQGPNGQNRQVNIKEKPVQETERPEVSTLDTCKDKVFAETEIKDQESYRPKILEGEDRIQELAEEKTNVSRKLEEEEETAEKNIELNDDGMSRKAPEIEQRGSDAMKGQEEEKEEIQELEQEEKVSDGGKKIVDEGKAENDDKSRKFEETDEHEEEEDQVQKTSGQGEVEDVESEKKTTEADKRFSDSAREAKEVQDMKEEELFVPERDHVSKIVDLMEDKIAEQEIEAEHDDLSTVHGSEEQESHEPTIHREHFKTKITGTEEPSSQEKEEDKECMRITEKEKSPNTQDNEGESHEKRHKIQELVEAGHKDHREEQKDDKLVVKRSAVLDKNQETEEKEMGRAVEEEKEILEMTTKTEDVSLRKDQDDEYPEMSTPYKRQEEEDEIQEPEEVGTSDYKEKVKKQDGDDVSRSQEPEKTNLDELEQTNIPQGEDMIQEPVEMRAHDDREKAKKHDGDGIPQSVKEEKVEYMAELDGKVEDDSSDKFHEIEEIKSHEDGTHEMKEKSKDFDKEEATDHKESEERGKTRAVEEEEDIAEMRTKTRDGSLKKVHDDAEKELSKPYKSQEKDKVHESVEARTSDYREKVKKQDGNDDDTLRSKDTRTVEEDTSEKIQEIEKQKPYELQRSFVKETEEKEKTSAVEENKTVERRTKLADEDKIQELVEKETSDYREKIKKQDGDDILRSQETEKLDLVEEESTDPKDKHIRGKGEPEEEEEIYEKVAQTETKVEDETNKKVEDQDGKEAETIKPYKRRDEDKIQELVEMVTSDKREKVKIQDGDDILRSQETEKLDLVQEEASGPRDEHRGRKVEPEEEEVAQTDTKFEETNKEVEENQKEEEDSLDDPIKKTQEIEKEESHDTEIHEKLDIVQEFVDEETRDQEDDELAMEAAAVHAIYDEDRSRILQTIKDQEQEEHKEQENIPKRHDPKVEGENEERIAEKETKEKEAHHVQESEGKTESFKDYDGESRKGGKTFETKSDYGTVRKVGETKRQESNEKKDQEPEEKIEELERKETSNHEVKLVTEEDSLTKGQEILEKESSNVAKRRPVGQEEIQKLKDVEKQQDEKKSEAGVEIQARTKGEKGIEGSEKDADIEMQAKIGIRMKEQETKRQEPYELLEDEEHDKIPEPTVEGKKYQREEENRVEDTEDEEMKRKSEDDSSRKIQKMKEEETDGLEKHMELSEIQENKPVKEAEGYKAVLEKKSMEDSSKFQGVEEKVSDQTEQEKIQELIAEEEEEQKEKAQRITQVESKANDGSSKKNETERLRGKKQHKDHQEVVETETSDQKKEEREEKIVGKEVTRDECDISRNNQDHEGEKLDKLGRHGEEKMSGLLASEETSNDEEENRAEAKTTIKDDGFREEQLAIVLRHREQEQKQLVAEKDTSGKAKDKRNQETKSRDESSIKTRENNKQESREQKRNYEETSEEEILKEKDNIETECEDGSSKKIQETDKEGSSEPRRDVERDKDPPVDSEDDSEELEVEVEDSEEDWEAEVIQEIDSDEDNDHKLRKIRRIKLGFRLVGGSTLFMSLIVIVFRLIRSKRKIKCYKF